MEEVKVYFKSKKTISEEIRVSLKEKLKHIDTMKDLEVLSDKLVSVKVWNNIANTICNINHFLSSIINSDYDVIMIEGMEEIKYLVEKIRDKEILETEIEFENNNFDLEKFYRKKLSGAAIVITENQMISVYSLLDHGATILNIYNYLENKDPKDSEWESPILKARNRGDIIIQLCDNCGSPVWLPSKMNDYQYNTLMGLVDCLKEIDENGNYQIELGLDYDGYGTPIKDAKEKINSICIEEGIYDVPRTR